MQHLASATLFFIWAMILITPFAMPLLLKQRGYVAHPFLSSFLSFITSVLLVCLFAYLPNFYADLQLEHLGFDFDGWSDEDRVRNIAPELRDEATRLYRSTMGIGWPLKAVFGVALLIPYQIFASGVVFIGSQLRK